MVIMAYPWGRGNCGFGHRIRIHVCVQNIDEWVFGTTKPVEIVHIDGPSHSTAIPFGFNEVHFDLDALRVFVAHPLVAFVGVRNFAVFVPFLGPPAFFVQNVGANLEFGG